MLRNPHSPKRENVIKDKIDLGVFPLIDICLFWLDQVFRMYRHNLISSGVFSEHVSLGGGVFHLLGLFLCLETLGVEIWHTVTNSTTLLYKARKGLVISMLTLKKPQRGGGGGAPWVKSRSCWGWTHIKCTLPAFMSYDSKH